MAQKFLYIVEHFVPFPASEYGGLWTVIAENDEECFDLIADYDDEQYPQHYNQLRENIMKCSTFALAEDLESRVVEEFTT